MNDTTNTTPPETQAPAIHLIDVLKLYEQRFSQEGIAMKLNCKQTKITGLLSKFGLKQADILKRMRAGETAEQIQSTARAVSRTPRADAVMAIADFCKAFESTTAGSALPPALATAYEKLKSFVPAPAAAAPDQQQAA